jgi:putative ABC transport system substrate-binding protein
MLAAGSWPAVVWARAACAQAPPKIPRVGLLAPTSRSETALWHEAFRLGLRDRGFVEGKNVMIEYRYAEGRSDRLADLVADLVRLKVDVIVASATADALAAQKATRAIPIVMVSVTDPVARGLVDSLAHPGGNITGLSQIGQELVGKRLELLKEVVPKLSRVAVLWNPLGLAATNSWKEIQHPARQLLLQLHSLEVRSAEDFDKGFEDATRARAGALIILSDPLIIANLQRVAQLAGKSRLPSIFHISEFADAGGLVTYGPDRSELFRHAATFVGKILKGAKPGDLPVEQPTKFELVLNMKTAKTLGIRMPQSMLQRADRVIE